MFRGQDVVVLGLPRGGVPVAAEIARALSAPLDVILVRKLGVPVQPELGMGAIGEGGVRIINPDVVRMARVSEDDIARVELAERAELHRRARRYRGDRPPVPVRGRTVIIVDDGVATGSTARAACQVARAQGAARVVLAAPVAPPAVRNTLAGDADEVIVLQTPARFAAIGEWYADFSQTSDAEVIALLQQGTPGRAPAGLDQEVTVEAGPVRLPGHLTVPAPAPAGLVVFAHGSGSGRLSPRNRYVAGVLTRAGLGTLLFDLLTPEEEGDRGNVFDIGLLAARLTAATSWLRGQQAAAGVPVGYFGASTGAAAALWAAAEPGNQAAAVVSRGGRPDLAIPRLDHVTAPTLLIVGGLDHAVLGMNRSAQQHLRCENKLTVVPGASHLFEEPGALERVAELARDWFTGHLAPAHATA
ncbi:MAG: dienelactone hydrolase family protein [Actinobacteria bacterium]|nr:dienelactone hydrolase family protein [Actinomycetota bacterium]